MLAIWDSLFYLLWLITPILILVKWKNWKGFFSSAFVFYILGLAEGYILATLDPARSSFTDVLWFIIGIPGSLLYSFVILFFLNLSQNFKKMSKFPRWSKILLLIFCICILLPVLLLVLLITIIFFTTYFGRITNFKSIDNKQNIEKTAYFFEFQKIVPAPKNPFEEDTVIQLKNHNSAAALNIGNFSSQAENQYSYTTFSLNGNFFLIITHPNSGSGDGDSYDVYNISTDIVPFRSLNTDEDEAYGASCVPPKLIGNQLELTTKGHCDMFFFPNGEEKVNFYIPLKI